MEALDRAGENANEEAYMTLLQQFRAELTDSRLIAFVDASGQGSLKHITGDFLADCKEEIASTLITQSQEDLFLHHSSTSIHFDLLQTLEGKQWRAKYLFASFNPDRLQQFLIQYQLPYQQLFLLRADHHGKIELAAEANNSPGKIVMSSAELASFNIVKPIPHTRWQLAIRLDPNYIHKIYIEALVKALVIWLLLTALIYVFYRVQKSRKHYVQQIKTQMAFKDQHDQLTRLLNRTHFEKKLSHYLNQRPQQTPLQTGVVLQIDIDKFQLINTNFGYAIGDELLAQISSELISFLPDNTPVSRLGNDEFAILLANLEHDKAAKFADELRKFMQKINPENALQERHITACIGVVILDQEQRDPQRVLLALSQSVAIAKLKGRNRVQLYQSDDNQLVQHAEEMKAIQSITEALVNANFVLYRQQIIKLSEPGISHYEVLLRMRHSADDTLVAPGIFIPAAEKYGLIQRVDLWVLEASFKAIAAKGNEDNNSYSINLSGVTIVENDLVEYVEALFARYKVDPTRIAFEITETAVISHLKSALRFIKAMKILGCRFYLDDFGTGLSSYAYLQQLPVDAIKIDGSFVQQIHKDPVSRVLVENIQRMAKAMDKTTIAECVENEETAELLKEIGVDYIQGFLIHRPEPWN